MKTLIRVLSVLFCVAPFGVANAVVSSTAGNNLTAYNNSGGAANNNRWNNAMNSRSGGNETSATADFGNCNALIMRCAQPKCANGGCTDLSVTYAIVNGCVTASAPCKQYGDELVQYISAQLVAQSTAKANEAQVAAQNAAAQAAAQQSAQQMAAMQQQMQQMQAEMAAQNAQTVAQLQSALDEQKQLTANAIAEAAAARETTQVDQVSAAGSDLSSAQLAAAERGVSADILAREQISGQIMSSIENAETQLKALKATMNDTFNYAGCDSRGNNCTGPKRVKMFKQKAEGFFDPYESVLDELYDALVLAQSVGVDITDIYMMLNGTCNVWGKYLCGLGNTASAPCSKWGPVTTTQNGVTVTKEECLEYDKKSPWPTYKTTGDDINCVKGKSTGAGVRGGHDCVDGQVIPPEDDISCVLQETLNQVNTEGDNEVQRSWLWADMDADSGANIRVGCASSALESSTLFRNRKKQASIDIETLQRIIAQDAPQSFGSGKYSSTKPDPDGIKWCNMGGEDQFVELQKAVNTRTLPKKICVKSKDLEGILNNNGKTNKEAMCLTRKTQLMDVTCKPHKNGGKTVYGTSNKATLDECICSVVAGTKWEDGKCTCSGDLKEWDNEWYSCNDYSGAKKECESDLYRGTWNQTTKKCDNAQFVDSDGVLDAAIKIAEVCW